MGREIYGDVLFLVWLCSLFVLGAAIEIYNKGIKYLKENKEITRVVVPMAILVAVYFTVGWRMFSYPYIIPVGEYTVTGYVTTETGKEYCLPITIVCEEEEYEYESRRETYSGTRHQLWVESIHWPNGGISRNDDIYNRGDISFGKTAEIIDQSEREYTIYLPEESREDLNITVGDKLQSMGILKIALHVVLVAASLVCIGAYIMVNITRKNE